MSRAVVRVLVRLIVVPCIVAVLTWLVLRSLEGWWLFAGLNDKRPGIVFVTAMTGIAAVVVGEFLAYHRQVTVRALAKRLSLSFYPELACSLKMQIKHLVIGKGSQRAVVVENVVRGDHKGMQLLMADLQVIVWHDEHRDSKAMTIWYFTDCVASFPKFTILPRPSNSSKKSKQEGDLSHFPPFHELYAIESDEEGVVQQIVNSGFCSYLRSRHNWQVYADGPCVAFVRDSKIAVDEWEMYLRGAMEGVKLLENAIAELVGRNMPMDNTAEGDSGVQIAGGGRTRIWGSETEVTGELEREVTPAACCRTFSAEKIACGDHVGPPAVEALQFEKKEAVGAFAVMDSLVNSASQRAMRYEVVSDFMQQLPPRTIHHQLRNENLPRVPLVLWVMFSPMIVLGTVAITWGLLHAGGMVLAGHEAFVVFGAVNLLPVCAAWVFFCRRRVVYLRILREGVCASATVRIQGSTVDYGLEDWLTCKHKVDVHFWAGEESVNGEVTMNGMQMKTLQRCLDDGTELFVLYRKDCPKYFCLSTQFVSRRVPV